MTGQMSLYDYAPLYGPTTEAWQYDEDNGHVMCRCPDCGGRLLIGLYQYINVYRFCPYCGQRLEEGALTSKRKQVYRLKGEDDGRRITLEIREGKR